MTALMRPELDRRREQMAALLIQSEDDLYARAGWHLLEQQRAAPGAAMNLPPWGLDGIGRKAFEKMRPGVRRSLCEQWRACEQVKLHDDPTSLGLAIAEALAADFDQLPAEMLAALVVKTGIRKFCNCRPGFPQPSSQRGSGK